MFVELEQECRMISKGADSARITTRMIAQRIFTTPVC